MTDIPQLDPESALMLPEWVVLMVGRLTLENELLRRQANASPGEDGRLDSRSD